MNFNYLGMDRFATDFGDGAVLLPIFGLSIILFAVFGWVRGAIVWGGLAGTALALLMTVKFIGLEWAYLSDAPGRAFSISGHVAAGSAIYGSLLNLLIFRKRKSLLACLPVPVFVASLFSYTRLALHSHTPAEVALGAILGVSVALISSRVLVPLPSRLIIPTFAIMLITIMFFHGDHSHTETLLQTQFSAWTPDL
ncbi:phosphatase PAP2 family protein [Gluconacetobacter sacchari]|uniref:phosphatase PAP2 family protein n=1 Tax=Gluconacetobacter sacchari TaxID=92759 RepID=UPI0039B4F5E2